MKLPPYPKYKPSGTDWLGEVPEHWQAKRLKGAATYWVSNVDKVAVEDEMPVRLCNYTDVYYHDHITPSMELMETTATPEEIRRFGLKVGDVVITKDSEEWSDIAVPALVVESAPDLVCGYHLAIVRPRESELLGRFLLRVFQACAVNQQFQMAATGVTRYGLPKSSIGEAWLPLPSPPEQCAIAGFLDRETEKIDALVAKKRALIEKLREKRAALISRTVTRGLPPDAAGINPHPKLKASGIEWHGDVPSHWNVVRLRFLVEGIVDTEHKTVEFDPDGDYLVARTTNIRGGSLVFNDAKYTNEYGFREWTRRGKPQPGEILFTREAPAGEACIVPSSPKLCLGQRVVLLRVKQNALNSSFAIYSIYGGLAHEFIEALSAGSTVPHFNMSDISSIPFLVPPIDEQRAIADYLDRETGKIDRMVGRVEAAIERLQEYRTALITAAVTGKIDVRSERVDNRAVSP